MSREAYFAKMRETSEQVTPPVLEYIDNGNFQEPVMSMMEAIPKRRAGQPRLRDLLLRLSYEISGGDDWIKVIPPYAAATELYNDSTYVVNWFLDGKGELQTKKDKKNAVIAGFLLRELAQKVIESQEASEDKTCKIVNGLSEVNSYMYRGQNLDLFVLTIDRFNDFKELDVFLPALYEKGKMLCGYFSKWIADTGVLLADGGDEYKRALGNFAIELGTGLQLANESGDFIPSCDSAKTVEKCYKDQFSDIVNGRLTMPIWYCLKHGTDEQKRALRNLVGRKSASFEEQEMATYALRDSGAFGFMLAEADRLMKNCLSTLRTLPRSEERYMLETMATVVRKNKFYATLRDRYGVHALNHP